MRIALIAALFVCVLGTLWPNIRHAAGEGNLYAHLAQALLEGRLDVRQPLHDVATYKGRHYVPFPPFPAVVLLPFVAVFGPTETRPVLISIALSLLNAAVILRILGRLGASSTLSRWMAAAFLLGSGYWMCVATSGSVWFFAHVVGVTGLLLALHESLVSRRGIFAGLFLGLAVLSRQMAVFALPFLATALWDGARPAGRARQARTVAGFLVATGLCIGAYLAYNAARFGHPLDTGYAHIELQGFQRTRADAYGLFHIVYVPFNLIQLLLQGFHIEFFPPTYLWPGRIRMDPFGTSITFASPFVFLAFWAEWKPQLRRAAWISIALAIAVTLLYGNNGWVQVNAQRFTLDFLPVLMVLVALGARRVPDRLWKATVVYSIALNVIALFAVPLLDKLSR